MLLICETQTYRVIVTLSLETVEHHSFTAAAGRGPWWTDEHPDEGICGGRVQTLCQAEEVGGLATTYIRSPLITQQCCGEKRPGAVIT